VTTAFRPTRAVVDLEAVRHNVRALKPDRAELMAVVKANAYGHGEGPVAGAALEAGATWLGVALVEEGIRLREAGLDAPILLLSELPGEAARDALAADLTPTVYSLTIADAVTAAGESLGRTPRVHVKVDTGMHRVGIPPERAPELAARLRERGVEIEGVWTHFVRSEEVDEPSTAEQLKRFLEVVDVLEAAGIRPRYRHAANSGATIAWPESHLDLVRVGVAVYGIEPGPQLAGRVDLRPAMSLRSRVSHVQRLPAGEAVSYGHRYRLDRDGWIATVPIGYADGYLRALSNVGRVLIRGARRPVAGTVTMDQILVDCGDDPVEVGDEVVLFGRQGDEEIRAEEVAGWAGTIGYEIVCAVGARVPREHRG
jgi:alanine racemase